MIGIPGPEDVQVYESGIGLALAQVLDRLREPWTQGELADGRFIPCNMAAPIIAKKLEEAGWAVEIVRGANTCLSVRRP